MKTQIFTLVIFFQSIIVLAQIEEKMKPCPLMTAVISNVRLNIIYQGVANDITVNTPKNPSYTIEVTTDNGQIEKVYDGWYRITPSNGSKANISVYLIKDAVRNLNSIHEFRVRPLPAPEIKIVEGTGWTISSSAWIKLDSLKCSTPSFPYSNEYEVLSFNISLVHNGQIVSRQNLGKKLNAGSKQILKSARQGDTIIIDEVLVVNPITDEKRRIEPKILKVENGS